MGEGWVRGHVEQEYNLAFYLRCLGGTPDPNPITLSLTPTLTLTLTLNPNPNPNPKP